MKPFTLTLILLSSLQGLIASAAQAQIYWENLLPPDRQGSLRSEKSLTVGLPLTLPFNLPSNMQVRMGENWLLGGSFENGDLSEDKDKKDEVQVYRPVSRHEYRSDGQQVTAYCQYYFSKTSGFYMGLGAASRWGTYTEILKDSDGEHETAKGHYRALYAGPSFGWTWIWNNGLTFGFDISRRKRIESMVSTTPLTGGAAANTLERVEEENIPETTPGTFILGYSF